jgi:hypothetical protein
LPVHSRWTFADLTIDFRFQRSRTELRPISDADVVGGGPKPEWTNLWVVGEFDVAEGGGAQSYIVIRPADGAVCGLDVEADPGKEIRYFNSSIDRFVRAFHL